MCRPRWSWRPITSPDGASRGDYGKAFEWYTRAATAGDGGAQYIVASYYERGEPGVVEKDIEQAKIWYARAAAHGDPGALAKLRSLIEQGLKAKQAGAM